MEQLLNNTPINWVQVTDPITGRIYYAPAPSIYPEKGLEGNTNISDINVTNTLITASLIPGFSDTPSALEFTKGDDSTFSISLDITPSSASYAQTASYALYAVTSSYVETTVSASYAQTASYFSGTVTSASYALTASYLEGGITIDTGSFATTGSNIFIGNQIITGSLHQSGTFYPDQIDWFSSSIGYDTGSYILTTTANGLTTYAGYGDVADKLALYMPTVSASVSASYATTASYSNTSTSASYAQTASYAVNAVSASYATNGGVTQIIAGPNITVSPTTGVGQVTISSTGGGGGTGNTATGSYGSFYDTTIQTNVASTARSMSLNTTDITNGVSISGSTNPYNTYIKTENAGVYDIQFSAQVDKTDSGTDEIWIWIRKNGTNLSDTATSVQLTGNGAHYVAAWNFFVNAAANDYFQLMWYSPDANVRLHAEPAFGIVPGIPSLIVTANRVDQFLSNTGSFSGSFTGNFTGSLLGTATTASYVQNAQTASYLSNLESELNNVLIFNLFIS